MNPQDVSILAVDDNLVSSELLSAILSPLGYRVHLLNDATRVLETLRRESIDLILMDVMMPKISGIEVCRQIQAEPGLKGIPVIFVTAIQNEDLLQEAFGAGGVDYITKPFITSELLMRVNTHLRLRTSERLLRRQLEQRELLLTTLAHDLRAQVGASARILDRVSNSERPLEDSRSLLRTSGQALNRTYQLLEDMLVWANSLHERLPFKPQWQALAELAQDCLEQAMPRAADKQIKLRMELSLQAQIFADANLLRSILGNLLGNAIKFSPPGSTVILRSHSAPGSLSLDVVDAGIGISPQLASKLLEQQPVPSIPGTAGERGSGMGLRLCQTFAQRHGASLDFVSQPGQGSTFTLSLPQPVQPTQPLAEAATLSTQAL